MVRKMGFDVKTVVGNLGLQMMERIIFWKVYR